MNREHVLVSSVGPTDYEQTEYILEGVGQTESHLSPVALGRLLDVDRVFIARTPDSGAKWDETLGTELETEGITVEIHDIPAIEGAEDIDTTLDLFAEAFREGTQQITLDITHSFRTLPMVFFVSLAYLESLGDVAVEGIYFGKFSPGDNPSRFIDLTYLYTLMDWFYAMQNFQQTGNLRAVSNLLSKKKADLFKQGKHPSGFAELSKKMEGSHRHLDSGLTLESGLAIRDALQAIESVDESEFVGPEGAVLEPLEDALQAFGLTQSAESHAEIELNDSELKRQAEIVRFYTEKGRYWVALECARELFLNRILYDIGGTKRTNWLEKEVRRSIKEEYLYHSDNRQKTGNIPRAIKLWEQLGEYRNYYAHAGFDKNRSPPDVEPIDEVLFRLCDLIGNDDFWEQVET